MLLLLYTLGSYTPAFRLMYDLLPAVALYRRPADATFVLVALVAMIAGYLVHRWLTGTVPTATRRQRAVEIACPIVLICCGAGVGPFGRRHRRRRSLRWRPRLCLRPRRSRSWCWRAGLMPRRPVAAAGLIAAFMAFDLAVNQAPHVSTALPPGLFDALRREHER